MSDNAELRRLTAALVEGELDAAEQSRLEQLVVADVSARRCYIETMFLLAKLQRMHGGEEVESRESRVERESISGQWSVASGQRGESGEWRVESEGISGQWPVVSGQKVDNQKSEIINHKYPTSHAPRPTPLVSTLHSWAFSYAVATLLLSIALLGAWFSTITHYDADSFANNNSRRVTPSGGAAKDTSQFVFVGKVSGMVDCQFAESSTSTVAGAAVSLNRRYALQSGLMEISYDSGAKVILQGPCDFTVESPRSGYLQVGKLVAKVESQESRVERKAEHSQSALTLALSQGERGPNFTSSRLSTLNSRLFAVRTPTALVEDLGTEFGVEVSASGETSSHVFAGRVVMRVEGAGGGGRGTGDNKSEIINHKSEILLSAGQSARVERDAKSGEMTLLSGEKADSSAQSKFVRRLREPPKELDLLDIVAGGNGTGNRRERGIDPASGQQDPLFVPSVRDGDRRYVPVSWHQLLDGVFVPNGGEEAVTLDSAGHTYVFPRTEGKTYGSIWARAADVNVYEYQKNGKYWIYGMGRGGQFMPQGRGLLALCANAGITFNIKAIRRTFPDVQPRGFHAVAGLGDAASLSSIADGMADLWVFVDGRLEFHRNKLRPQDGAVDVVVKLGPADRFLTLVSTDSTGSKSCDWVVFGDPVIEMDSTENQAEDKRMKQ